MAQPQPVVATCCIAGAGPAGMTLGLLLARSGVDVVVLEKHGDFLRDFRGDTIHASTIRMADELGLGERFRALPHQVANQVRVLFGGETAVIADLARLGGVGRRLWFMPQWDFLDFVAAEARRYPGFTLLMNAEVTGLVREDARVAGVTYDHGDGAGEVRADLTVACDGRSSRLRAAAGLTPIEFGAPMDVLWLRVARRGGAAEGAYFCMGPGQVLILIGRGDYWQAGYVIAKDSRPVIEDAGIGRLRAALAALAPFLDDGRLDAITAWDDIRLLRVQVNRLRRWHLPGLLLIGDAAHAMSPVGGVGINLAIQDAIAAANLLAEPLRHGCVEQAHLAGVQRRRELPTTLTQMGQRAVQRCVFGRILAGDALVAPRLLRLGIVRRVVPYLMAAALRVAGAGVRPEHVRTPAMHASQDLS